MPERPSASSTRKAMASMAGLAVLATTGVALAAPSASAAETPVTAPLPYYVGGLSSAVSANMSEGGASISLTAGTAVGQVDLAEGKEFNVLLGYTMTAEASRYTPSEASGEISYVDYNLHAASNETGAEIPPPPPYSTRPVTTSEVFDDYAAVSDHTSALNLRTAQGASQCGPTNLPIAEATTSISGLDLRPIDFDRDQVRDISLLRVPGTQTASTRSYLKPNGIDGARGASATTQGPTGTYELLDGEVTVNVVQPVSVEATANGLAPSTVVMQPAVANVSTANGSQVLVPGVPFTFTSQARPDLDVTVTVPDQPFNSTTQQDGTFATADATGFTAAYTQTNPLNPDVRSRRGTITQGQVKATAQVPVGGVTCAPEPVVTPDPTQDPTPEPTPVPTPEPTPVPDLTEVDSDGDGLTDAREARLGTDPLNVDSDDDGLADVREVKGIGVKGLRFVRTDPMHRDTDRDGLSDGREVRGVNTGRHSAPWRSHPRRKDTDRDGLRDRAEVTGLKNRRFHHRPTNPWDRDSDNDGVRDKVEVKAGANPNAK